MGIKLKSLDVSCFVIGVSYIGGKYSLIRVIDKFKRAFHDSQRGAVVGGELICDDHVLGNGSRFGVLDGEGVGYKSTRFKGFAITGFLNLEHWGDVYKRQA